MDKTVFFNFAADQLRKDFFEPAGLHPARVPIVFKTDDMEELMFAAGVTHIADPASRVIKDIFINVEHPFLAGNPVRQVAVLAHEMIHTSGMLSTSDGFDAHLMPEFQAMLDRIGLAGDPHETVEGPAFMRWYQAKFTPRWEAQTGEVL